MIDMDELVKRLIKTRGENELELYNVRNGGLYTFRTEYGHIWTGSDGFWYSDLEGYRPVYDGNQHIGHLIGGHFVSIQEIDEHA